jgi:hypothetical protein
LLNEETLFNLYRDSIYFLLVLIILNIKLVNYKNEVTNKIIEVEVLDKIFTNNSVEEGLSDLENSLNSEKANEQYVLL